MHALHSSSAIAAQDCSQQGHAISVYKEVLGIFEAALILPLNSTDSGVLC